MYFSQKNVIQLSSKSVAVPVPGAAGKKITVVKSADGRIILKTSEPLEKTGSNKPVTTVSSQPSPTKPLVVNVAKPSTIPISPAANKEDAKDTGRDPVIFGRSEEPLSPKTPSAKDPRKVSIIYIWFLFLV